MKKQIISMAVMAVVFAACGGSKAPATVVGSWVMPINGQPGEVQGIKLEENGEASSINMHTLIYKEWEQQGDQLYLTVKSIGNGIEIEGVDTLKIDKLTPDSLVLSSNYGYTLEYVSTNKYDIRECTTENCNCNQSC